MMLTAAVVLFSVGLVAATPAVNECEGMQIAVLDANDLARLAGARTCSLNEVRYLSDCVAFAWSVPVQVQYLWTFKSMKDIAEGSSSSSSSSRAVIDQEWLAGSCEHRQRNCLFQESIYRRLCCAQFRHTLGSMVSSFIG